MNGWLNLYKPPGISSARAVSVVKQILPKKTKIGHSGTLDLEAEGILPLAIGEATKLAGILCDAQKEYIFTIQFGAITDTADASGKIVQTTHYIPSQAEVFGICEQFLGEIRQIPPKFSALKVGGKRAYYLARNNAEFELKPRHIRIFNLECMMFDSLRAIAKYKVKCSKGTYVRSLCEDIAYALRSLGFARQIKRIAVGAFREERSVKLSHIENMIENVNLYQNSNHDHLQKDALMFLEDKLLDLECVLMNYRCFDLNYEQYKKVKNGVDIIISDEKICLSTQEAKLGTLLPNSDKDHVINRFHDSSTDFANNLHIDSIFCYLKYDNKLVAIGNLKADLFKATRVFNLL